MSTRRTAPVLVLNSGSSSLKFALIEPISGEAVRVGSAARLGTKQASLSLDGAAQQDLGAEATHAEALGRVLSELGDERVSVVGHRVVHGAEQFTESVVIDADTRLRLEQCTPLAPLHNPANLLGIDAACAHFPDATHVAVFDTAFHRTLPPKAFRYAIPGELYERYQIRRYGFHGSSHGYVAAQAASRLGRPLSELQLVTAHLGNGCSACAVRAGRSVDTTMGLTPLEGLVMGTRSGDVDPNMHQLLVERSGKSLSELTELLNHGSGLLGLSGTSNDMRTLVEAAERGDARAQLAIDVFCYRLAKGILGMCAALERVDALVFTGGIGEHSASVRQATLAELSFLGADIDEELNQRNGDEQGRITKASSRLLSLVIPTNEELVIAREAARLARR